MSKTSCSLPTDTLRSRRALLQRELLPKVTLRRELPNGIAFQLPAEERQAAREFVDYERDCCSFATFTITEDEMDTRFIWVTIQSESHSAEVKRLFAPTRKRRWLAAGVGGAVVAFVLCELPLVVALGSAALWCN